MSSPSEKALSLLRYLPRFSLENLVRSPYSKKLKSKKMGQYRKYPEKRDLPTFRMQMKYLPVGFNYGETTLQRRFPIENYYKDIQHKRQYPPMSLHTLQMLIDTHVLDTTEPIDLASLCLTNHYKVDPMDNCYGVHLTDEGIDQFKAKVNIEVQHTSEQVIAAVERNGGIITTAYYDITSVVALSNPKRFFQKGTPIPKRLLPPPDRIAYYTDPKMRGYLADPDKIAEERFKLAQKYGYTLPNVEEDSLKHILLARKDPNQVFFGLEPGWVINLRDKEILIPVDEELKKYYNHA